MQRARALLEEADEMMRSEDFSGAIKKLDSVLVINDGNFVLTRKARCLIGLKNYDEALSLIGSFSFFHPPPLFRSQRK